MLNKKRIEKKGFEPNQAIKNRNLNKEGFEPKQAIKNRNKQND